MLSLLRPALSSLLFLSVVTGGLYPLLTTALAQLLFPHEAQGSLVVDADGRPRGSALIGQPFDDPRYFWGRPSATARHPYDASASTGSNLGPSNPALRTAIEGRISAARAAHPGTGSLPVDAVTTSGSGLDPHVSPATALLQVPRVAAARGLPEAEVRSLVQAAVEPRTLGVLGEPRVNVFLLNRALDGRAARGRP